MKCNMELPCRLCVLAKREQECLLLPPNPPSEEEKSRTARRRLRNLRRQELEHQKLRKSASVPQNSTVSPPATNASTIPPLTAAGFSTNNSVPSFTSASTVPGHGHSPGQALTSPSVPLVVSQISSRTLLVSTSSDQILRFYVAEHLHPVPVKTHTGVNINHFAFVMEYATQCKSLPMPTAAHTLLQWKNMVAPVNTLQLEMRFRENFFWEDGGVQEVIDLSTTLTVAHNMLVQFPLLHDHSQWLIDKYLLQHISFVFILLAKGDVLEGSSQRARRWLDMSREIKDMLAPFVLSGDCIYLSQWMIQSKLVYVLLNAIDEFAGLFESYLATVLSCEEFVHQLHLTEQNGPDSDQFIACARVWVVIKIIEIEVNVLQSKAGLQSKFPPLQDTIVPDRQLIYRVYGLDFSHDPTDFGRFNQDLMAAYEYFRLFENATLPRDVIYLYLSLYGRIHRRIHTASDKVTALLAGNIDMEVIAHNSEALVTTMFFSYLLIRWLSIVQADSPHFPSLRFAQYISIMMSMFNIFNDIDDRLGLPPGALLVALMRGSNVHLIVQFYGGLCHQAIFAAVLPRFIQPDSLTRTLDLGFVFDVVMKSLSKTLPKMSVAPPFSPTPLLTTIVQAVDCLYKMANDPNVVASTPEQFVELFYASMPEATAACFVTFLFGSVEKLQGHIVQLWRLRDHVNSHGHAPIPFTSKLALTTDFLRQFKSSYLPFVYTQDMVNDYLVVVVDAYSQSQ